MLRIVLILTLVLMYQSTAFAQADKPALSGKEMQDKAGASPETADDRGLMAAIKEGDLAHVILVLDRGASPDAVDEDQISALGWAVRMNRADLAAALLARKAKVDLEESDGGTALQAAAAAGRPDLVKLLIAHGADVNRKDNGGHTALMVAAFADMYKRLPDWIVQKLFDVDEEEQSKLASMGDQQLAAVKLLLASGADVNAQADDCGQTALMIAAIGGSVELGRILLAHGARVDLGSGDSTPLKLAEMGESPADFQKMLDGESDAESKQALLSWLQTTRPGRLEFAGMLKKAGARN